MRKITQQAVDAFNKGKPFKSGNTEVKVDVWGAREMFLHNNLIATQFPEGGLEITTAGWNTPTTRERLNGLNGVSVNVSKGQLYLNGEVWDGNFKQVQMV